MLHVITVGTLMHLPQARLEAVRAAAAVEIEDGDEDDDAAERACPLDGLEGKKVPMAGDDTSDAEKAARATVAEVALRMLDWMGDHKTTWSSAEGAWDMLRSLLPEKSPMCVFSRVKAILVSHLEGRLRKIDVCPCGYTVYMNCTSATFRARRYQNAHRTCCPREQCGLSRHVPGIVPAAPRKVRPLLARCVFVILCVDVPTMLIHRTR